MTGVEEDFIRQHYSIKKLLIGAISLFAAVLVISTGKGLLWSSISRANPEAIKELLYVLPSDTGAFYVLHFTVPVRRAVFQGKTWMFCCLFYMKRAIK